MAKKKATKATGTAVAKRSSRSAIDEKFFNSTEKLAIATSRKEALSQIPESVRQVAEEMLELASKAERDSVMVAWQEGKLVYTLLNDPDKTINAVVATVAGLIGVSWRSLYDFAKLYELWPDEEKMRKLAASECANGKVLMLHHFCAAARLGRRQDAEALLKKARSENLSVREIAQAVSETKGGSPNPQGRTPNAPATFMDGFRCMSRSLTSFINYQAAHGEAVLKDFQVKLSQGEQLKPEEMEKLTPYYNTMLDAYEQVSALIESFNTLVSEHAPHLFAASTEETAEEAYAESEESGENLFSDSDEIGETQEVVEEDTEEVVEEDDGSESKASSKGKGRRRRRAG